MVGRQFKYLFIPRAYILGESWGYRDMGEDTGPASHFRTLVFFWVMWAANGEFSVEE